MTLEEALETARTLLAAMTEFDDIGTSPRNCIATLTHFESEATKAIARAAQQAAGELNA